MSGLLGSSSGSNASGPTQLQGYRVQTSIFGIGIPILLGTNRLSGNVVWVGDWISTPVASGGKSGGNVLFVRFTPGLEVCDYTISNE